MSVALTSKYVIVTDITTTISVEEHIGLVLFNYINYFNYLNG